MGWWEVLGWAVVRGAKDKTGSLYSSRPSERRAGRVGELARAEEVRPITAVSGWVLPSMGFR